MPTDHERMVVRKSRMAAKAVRFGHSFNVAQHETNEPITLTSHPIHDRATIDADDTIMVDAKRRRRCDGVSRVRGSDEQLARHAADTGAGGAIGAAFDEHCGRACSPGSAVRGKPRRPGADDGDINLRSPHFALSFIVWRDEIGSSPSPGENYARSCVTYT